MVLGMSTTREVGDGGFSPETDEINLINTPGVMYSPALPTDKSTNLVGDMAVSCENATTLSGQDSIFLAIDDATKDGSYYYWNGSVLTLKRTDSTNNYAFGKNSIVSYKNGFYATSNEAIVYWTADDVTFNVSFKAFSDTSAPHPSLVFEDNIYFADGDELIRQTSAGVAGTVILSLPTGTVITALGIDPGTGKMLISTTLGYNSSDTVPTVSKVSYYDGFSNKTNKSVIVDNTIQGFYSVGAVTYCSYGQNLGYWNGSGIQFLRNLSGILFQNEYLMYQGRFTNIGSTLYVVEGSKILAFGPITQGGSPVFYYAYKNRVNANIITHIKNLGQNILGIGFKDEKFYSWSTTSVASTNTQNFYSNNYTFDDEVWIRRVRVIYKNTVADTVDPGSLFLTDASNTLISDKTYDLRNVSGAASYIKDINNVDLRVKEVLFRLLLEGVNPGVKRVIFYGELANLT